MNPKRYPVLENPPKRPCRRNPRYSFHQFRIHFIVAFHLVNGRRRRIGSSGNPEFFVKGRLKINGFFLPGVFNDTQKKPLITQLIRSYKWFLGAFKSESSKILLIHRLNHMIQNTSSHSFLLVGS